MATNKKAKHTSITAIPVNTEQQASVPEHPANTKTDTQYTQPIPISPDRSNRAQLTGKHPHDVTDTTQDTHETSPIVHTTWAAYKAAQAFPIQVIITNITLGGEKYEKNHHGCY